MGLPEVPVQGDHEHVLRDLHDVGAGAQDPDRGHHPGGGHDGTHQEARPLHVDRYPGLDNFLEGTGIQKSFSVLFCSNAIRYMCTV